MIHRFSQITRINSLTLRGHAATQTDAAKMNMPSKKICLYFRDRDEVIAVYLFGSYAQGRERARSDIDIGVLLHPQNRDAMQKIRSQYLTELGRVLRKDIHIVILNTAGEELLRQVFSKGKCILINNHQKHAYIRMVMFARIADFDYYRRPMQAGLINKVTEGITIG